VKRFASKLFDSEKVGTLPGIWHATSGEKSRQEKNRQEKKVGTRKKSSEKKVGRSKTAREKIISLQ